MTYESAFIEDLCRRLEDGWDGDSAPVPNAAAITMMRSICQRVRYQRDDHYGRISPDVDGGLVLSIRRGSGADRSAIIICSNDGDAHLILDDRTISTAPKVINLDGMEDNDLNRIIRDWLPAQDHSTAKRP